MSPVEKNRTAKSGKHDTDYKMTETGGLVTTPKDTSTIQEPTKEADRKKWLKPIAIP